MFAVKYESFVIDDEPNYGVFEFDDLCVTANCMIASPPESASKSNSPPSSLELKPLPDSLKSFLEFGKSLHVIITSDLDWGLEEKLIALLRENKEVIC